MDFEHILREIGAQYEKFQVDMRSSIRAKTLLESQLSENRAVEKEFELLKQDDEVFKLIGPVLVKQEKPEAVSNVKKRIEYISGEMLVLFNSRKRLDNQIKDLESKSESKRAEMMKIQQTLQQLAAKQAEASA